MAQEFSYLVSYYINGLLHGAYITLFFRWYSLPSKLAPWFFVLMCWVIFVLTNIDAGINLYLLISGFWESLPYGGPAVYFATNVNNTAAVWREVNYQALVFVCDAFMVYRVWRLCNKNWWIASVPFILLVAETIMGIVTTVIFRTDAGSPLFTHTLAGFLALNVAVQVVITFLMGYHLLNPEDLRHLPPEQRFRRIHITRVLVESGFLISATVIVNLGFSLVGSVFEWIPNVALGHLYAITTIMIVLRLQSLTARQSSNEGKTSLESALAARARCNQRRAEEDEYLDIRSPSGPVSSVRHQRDSPGNGKTKSRTVTDMFGDDASIEMDSLSKGGESARLGTFGLQIHQERFVHIEE